MKPFASLLLILATVATCAQGFLLGNPIGDLINFKLKLLSGLQAGLQGGVQGGVGFGGGYGGGHHDGGHYDGGHYDAGHYGGGHGGGYDGGYSGGYAVVPEKVVLVKVVNDARSTGRGYDYSPGHSSW